MIENIDDMNILKTASLLINLYSHYRKDHAASEEYEKAISIAIMALNQVAQDTSIRK